MKPDKVTCTVYVKYELNLRQNLADASPDVVDIGSEYQLWEYRTTFREE